uniref:Uncharacterized protein n=1 Tax=Podoviridae sp. ctiVc2 TaxID=2827745 RepID=A0A8S5S9Y7_9CAUD|nr:MAG TPA: hypothetical protein [Caudoviricetes sp.]DAF47769.1 MAG TPA: hypothetical protein [Podoviridae sp. ctiVc2]DAN41761.1 MAG TPA: hypothetical protein [Caudoviricetes sp.]DAQ82117.1 MAG TPA: hypothetical protein [Caudoviricetes sp.]DAR78717.1 MAG TPA: hypothetical protein [Caudoviricetes sp.]
MVSSLCLTLAQYSVPNGTYSFSFQYAIALSKLIPPVVCSM